MTLKARLYELLCKLISIKVIIGVGLPTILLIFEKIDPAIWLASTLAVLGVREISKKLPDQFGG